MTSRRSFLATFAGAFALDPERALWVRGAKTISIAAPRPLVREFFGHPIAQFLDVGDVVQFRHGPECYLVTSVITSSSFFVRSKPVGLLLTFRPDPPALRRVDNDTRDWLLSHPFEAL